MNSYHVFVSPKEGVSSDDLEKQMKLFLDGQIAENHMRGYRILKYSDIANFEGMSDYQIICDYRNEDELKEGFERMRPDRWKEEPHASMMKMVDGLRVSFSSDISKVEKK